VLTEHGIKYRLQHLQQCLLDQPIRHRRNAKLALTTLRLGSVTRRTGLGRTSLQQLCADYRSRTDQMPGCLIDV
jgi:hypothetical protein